MTNTDRNQFVPDFVTLPGEILQETLEERGMSQTELAERTGRPVKMINEIIKGKAPITPETALQLERVLGVPATFWNNLERNYREDLARIKEAEKLAEQTDWLDLFPLSQMRKLGWISKTRNKIEQVDELLNFFGVASRSEWESFCRDTVVSYRRSNAFSWDDAALSAWLRKGELDAADIVCRPYNREAFKQNLSIARELTTQPDPALFVPGLQQLGAEAGVAIVFVPELPKTRVSGATRWLKKDKALIQLSLRHKSNDHLWFTFFHEAGHILLHGKRDVFVDIAQKSAGNKEDEANAFARDFLIPPHKFSDFTRRHFRFSAAAIGRFARELGIAPGIVVGRLQHEGLIPHSHFNDLKVRYEWKV